MRASLSSIQDGPVPTTAPSKSDFINNLLELKDGQYFEVTGIDRRNLYQRLQYAEYKYAIRALFKRSGDRKFQVFLVPKRNKA